MELKRRKRSLKKYVILFVLICLFFLLIFQTEPSVVRYEKISASSVNLARKSIKSILEQFASRQTLVQVELTKKDVDSLSALASYPFDNTSVSIDYSVFGISLVSTSKFNTPFKPLYINVSCLSGSDHEHSYLDKCYIGDLYIPGVVVESLIKVGTWALFDKEVSATVGELFSRLEVTNSKIVLTASKDIRFKERINNSLRDAADVVRTISRNRNIEPEKVASYLSYLESIENNSRSLAYFIGEIMQHAALTSQGNDAIEENAAVIWALAIKFGSGRFTRFVGLSDQWIHGRSSLRGREDLALHFLYSAILQQLGREELGFKVGELKEILDSGKGGSGFSFADLAADKAGLAFARNLTQDEKSAIDAQNLLAGIKDESLFFPFVHDLPEGLSEKSLQQVFGGVGSVTYKKLESDIDLRIGKLPLFALEDNKLVSDFVFSQKSKLPLEGEWLNVDTHTHTKYSDGNFGVLDLASNAKKFGCDAIAITDHGDSNYKKVLSDLYFDEIEAVNNQVPGISVLPGFEWNIPPYRGREHMTVLFPNSNNIRQDLRYFREKFDHYGGTNPRLLSAEPAFNWLNKSFENGQNSPVVFYNHPSRKDSQVGENFYDMEKWLGMSSTIIGMSGAPGHQKKRGDDNGSYSHKMRTQDGWDPSVAKIGGDWDKLLQKGFRVSAARAASDFHNPKMDYWPCEFSSTHVFSAGRDQNDVLRALRGGNMFAQHGKFVASLDFTIMSPNGRFTMGDVAKGAYGGSIDIDIRIKLNEKDWQGYETSLDDFELIFADENSVESISVFPPQYMKGNSFHFQYKYALLSKVLAVRLRAKSIQAGKHHYMLYSNPIYIRTE